MIRLLLLGLGMLLAMPAAAEFSVQSAAPVLQVQADGERVLGVNTRLALALTPATEEALNSGIPLEIVIDIEFSRHRWWWGNKLISDWAVRRRLSFHALSRQYLVSGTSTMQPSDSFGSLALALAHAGNLSRLEFVLPAKKQIEPGARHLLRVRARLDIEALPAIMRPLAYASPAWRLNSGWTTWSVRQ
jgi:hypothetical protein